MFKKNTNYKKHRKQLKYKVKSIQHELDSLCLNQVKKDASKMTSNYFAVQSLEKLNNQLTPSKYDNIIKPSKFNLSLTDGKPSITPNFSSDMILSRPRLDLNQLNLNTNSTIDQSNNNQTTHNQFSSGSFHHNNSTSTTGHQSAPNIVNNIHVTNNNLQVNLQVPLFLGLNVTSLSVQPTNSFQATTFDNPSTSTSTSSTICLPSTNDGSVAKLLSS